MVKRLVRQQRRHAQGEPNSKKQVSSVIGRVGREEEMHIASFKVARQIVDGFQRQAVPLVNYFMKSGGVAVRTVATDGHGTTWNDVYEEARLCCVAEDGAPIGEDDGDDHSDADKWIDESDISDSDEDEQTRHIRKLRKERFVPPPGHEYGLGEELAAIKIQNLERGRRARRSTAILREERKRKAARRAAKVERRRLEAFARTDARAAARQKAARAGAKAVLEARRGIQAGSGDLSLCSLAPQRRSVNVERKVLAELERLKAVEARAASEAKAARRMRDAKTEERVALMNEAFVRGVEQEGAEYRHQCRILRGRPQEPMSRRLVPPRPPMHIMPSASQPPLGVAKGRPHVPSSNYSAPKRYGQERHQDLRSCAAAASRKILARDRAQQLRHKAERDPSTVVGALAMWLDSLELYQRISKHHVRWRRDLSSGFVIADILSRFYPSDVSLHTFSITSNTKCKEDNWRQLSVFFRKRHFPVSSFDVGTALKARDADFAVKLLRRIYSHLARSGLVPKSEVLEVISDPIALGAPTEKTAASKNTAPSAVQLQHRHALPAAQPGTMQLNTPFGQLPTIMMAPQLLASSGAQAAGFPHVIAASDASHNSRRVSATGHTLGYDCRGNSVSHLSPHPHAKVTHFGRELRRQSHQEYAVTYHNCQDHPFTRPQPPPEHAHALNSRVPMGGKKRSGSEVVTAGGRRLKGVAQQRGMFGGGDYVNFRHPDARR